MHIALHPCDSPKAIARSMYSPVSRPDLIGVETPFHPITTWDCKYVPLKHTHMVKLQHYKRRHIQASEFPFTFLPVWPNKDCFQNLSQILPFSDLVTLQPQMTHLSHKVEVCAHLWWPWGWKSPSSLQPLLHSTISPPSKSQQNIWPQIVTNKKSAQSYHLRRARIAV